jgi:hypothetical protein
MGKGAGPVIIDAKYRVVSRAKFDRPSAASLGATRGRFEISWTVLIVAIDSSLVVHLLMKHLLNWG